MPQQRSKPRSVLVDAGGVTRDEHSGALEDIKRPNRAISARLDAARAAEKPARPRKRKAGRDLAGLKETDINAFNRSAEKEFVELVKRISVDPEPYTIKELLAEAAYKLDISTETAKRYLAKHTARSAEFKIEDGHIRRRPH